MPCRRSICDRNSRVPLPQRTADSEAFDRGAIDDNWRRAQGLAASQRSVQSRISNPKSNGFIWKSLVGLNFIHPCGSKNSDRTRLSISDNSLMERYGAGPRLIIVCGLPGSGKTTLAKVFESKLRAVRFSPDEWLDALALDLYDEERRGKIETLQWKFGQKLLALGLTVIVECGTWARSERDALRLGARALGAAVELHYLSAPEDDLFDRIRRRDRENPPIQRDAVSRWFETFQVPTPEEMALFDEPLITDLASDSA
jgi:predicted kinase